MLAEHPVERGDQHGAGITAGGNKPAIVTDQPITGERGFVGGHIKDQIKRTDGFPVIPLGIVNDGIGTQFLDKLRVAATAYAGDMEPHGLGDLYREGPDTAGSPNDQYLLAGFRLALFQTLQGSLGGQRHGGCLLESERRRFLGNPLLIDTGQLGQ